MQTAEKAVSFSIMPYPRRFVPRSTSKLYSRCGRGFSFNAISKMPYASERLQKIIAAAGIASRRKAEQLITSGHVQVNGTVITELGSKADPEERSCPREWEAAAGGSSGTSIFCLTSPRDMSRRSAIRKSGRP